MFEDDEDTIAEDTQENTKCEEASCDRDAVYRCTPDADYPVPEDDFLEVFTCAEHINLGLSYPTTWPGPPRGWRVEFLDVVREDLPN